MSSFPDTPIWFTLGEFLSTMTAVYFLISSPAMLFLDNVLRRLVHRFLFIASRNV